MSKLNETAETAADEKYFSQLRYYVELRTNARAFRRLPEYNQLLRAAGKNCESRSESDYYDER